LAAVSHLHPEIVSQRSGTDVTHADATIVAATSTGRLAQGILTVTPWRDEKAGGPVRVLLIHGEEQVSARLRERLARVGMNVVAVVDSPAAAVAEVGRVRPDLILMHAHRTRREDIDAVAAIRWRTDAPYTSRHGATPPHERYQSLTAREREVFALVVRGKLNKQIAADLGIAERTVKAHRARVMKKMGVASLADLARLAERLGV
jgi:DNA-binding NarL/FixJ family response regulator